MSVLSVAYVRTILQKDESYDSQLAFVVPWVLERAESIIGRKLESAEYTWYYDGCGKRTIMCRVYPVASVAVYLDADRAFTTALASTEYFLDGETGVIDLYDHITPYGVKTVKVVATAGYTEETLPADLKGALVATIQQHLTKLMTSAFGFSSMSAPDGGSATFELELPIDAKRIFDSYRGVKI